MDGGAIGLRNVKKWVLFILGYARPLTAWVLIILGILFGIFVSGYWVPFVDVVNLVLMILETDIHWSSQIAVEDDDLDVWQYVMPIFMILSGVISLIYPFMRKVFEYFLREKGKVYFYIRKVIIGVDDSIKGVEAWCYIRGFVDLFKFFRIPVRNQDIIMVNGALSASYFSEILVYNDFVSVIEGKIKSKNLVNLSVQIARYYLPSSGKNITISDRKKIYSALDDIRQKEDNAFIRAVCLNYMGLIIKHNISNINDLNSGESSYVQKAISHFVEARDVIRDNDEDERMSLWTGYICRNLGNMLLKNGQKEEGYKNLMLSQRAWERVVESSANRNQVTKAIFFNELCFVRMDLMGENICDSHQSWLNEIEEYLREEVSLASTEVVKNRFLNFVEKRKFLFVLGTRPEFIKANPIMMEMLSRNKEVRWMCTGQHYTYSLSSQIINSLNMERPVKILPEFSLSNRVGRWIEEVQALILEHGFTDVVVVGDTDSALAGALAAVRQNATLIHIEAGLRSQNEVMKEERNRFIIDHLSDKLFVTEDAGRVNLEKEEVSGQLFVVGNILSDSLQKIPSDSEAIGCSDEVVVTIHRDENLCSDENFMNIVEALICLTADFTVKFIAHPKVERKLLETGSYDKLVKAGVELLAPLSHQDFVVQLRKAHLIVTDSGGVQEEAAIEGVRCITIRSETERPSTMTCGVNVVIDPSEKDLGRKIAAIKFPSYKNVPALWDGKVAKRIVDVI